MAGPQSSRQALSFKGHTNNLQQSGFLQCETLSGLVPSRLTNKIHPVWSRVKWSSGFEYEQIKTALRLATRLLETALPVFHSVLCGEPVQVDEVAKDGELCFAFPDPLDSLTPTQKQETWSKISAFTEPIRFLLESEDEGWRGLCNRLVDERFSADTSLPGRASEIFISKSRLYQPLLNTQHDKSDIVQRQYWQFSLAAVLVHELAHAAVNAATTCDGSEYFLGKEGKTTEMGQETEAWLFGGVLPGISCTYKPKFYLYAERQQYSKMTFQITVDDHPCPALADVYEQDDFGFTSRNNDRSVIMSWNTSFPHINQMFGDQFWSKIVPAHGRQALFFARETGLRFTLDESDRPKPIIPHPGEKTDVLVGYWVDQHGLVRRRIDKMTKMETSMTKDVELAIRVKNIVATGIMQTD